MSSLQLREASASGTAATGGQLSSFVAASNDERVKALFFVTAPADAGLLPRLIEPFAKLDLVPHRMHASREAGDGSEVAVDLRIADVSRRDAFLVEKMLRAVVGVTRVIVVTEPMG